MLTKAPVAPYIPALAIQRARQFYETKVGLTPKHVSDGGVAFECAKGSWIFLYQSGGAGTSQASQAFWQVKDVEADVNELRSRGVVFEEYDRPGLKTTIDGLFSGGGTKAAWFKDSEGNIMALIEGV